MPTGRIIRFDNARGYGFIAPDSGGADVFVHAAALNDHKEAYASGVPVRFEVTVGDRGLKALAVTVIRESPAAGTAGVAGPERLTSTEFAQAVTNLLVESVPSLTGAQVAQLRQCLLKFAVERGWVTG